MSNASCTSDDIDLSDSYEILVQRIPFQIVLAFFGDVVEQVHLHPNFELDGLRDSRKCHMQSQF